MPLKEAFIAELKQEAAATRKMLEKVPFDKAAWKPHEKSMTLGRLATHIAENTKWIAEILQTDEIDFATRSFKSYTAVSQEDVLKVFQENFDNAIAALEKANDEEFNKHWIVRFGDKIMQDTKKEAAIRSWAYSHMIHHRGQLSVYLRLLDVAVPGMYGPSADEK